MIVTVYEDQPRLKMRPCQQIPLRTPELRIGTLEGG
jgi:hypothetical protein